MRTRPAGTGLTVGELRELIAGNGDNDFVTFPDDLGALVAVESSTGGVEFDFEYDSGSDLEDLETLRDFVAEITTGRMTKRAMVERAKGLS